MNWLRVPTKLYFKRGSAPVALRELRDIYNVKKAFIISEPGKWKTGAVASVDTWLRSYGIRTAEYFNVGEIPTFEEVQGGLYKIKEFAPDVVIGVGGKGVMSAAKAILLQYENPDLSLLETSEKYSAFEESSEFPPIQNKAKLVLISTDAQGGECAAYAVLADENGKKHVIASYELLPEMAIIDADFSEDLTENARKMSELQIMAKAVKALESEEANDYTKGFAMKALECMKEHLANAACLSEIAYSNAVRVPEAEIQADEEVLMRTVEQLKMK